MGPELSLTNPLVSPWKILLETYSCVGARDAERAGTQALLAEYLSTELGGRAPKQQVWPEKQTNKRAREMVGAGGEALSLFAAVALVPWFDLFPKHLQEPGAMSEFIEVGGALECPR